MVSTVALFPDAVNGAVTELTPRWRWTDTASFENEVPALSDSLRSPVMTSGHPTVSAPVVLAAVAALLSACSDGSTASAGNTSSSSTSSPSSADPSTGPSWTPLSAEPEGVPLEPGAYGLIANGVSDHVVVIRAPAGYQNIGGWTFVTGAPFHAMGFVTADRVPRDPCGSEGHTKFDTAVDPGPSVEDLAEALVAQKGAATSEPVPVRVAGHPGLYLTYRVAKGIDVSTCEARAFDIFSTGPGAWYLEASRERAAIWIVDVDGERLVLAWVAVPGVTRAQMREMTRMVQSARFVEP